MIVFNNLKVCLTLGRVSTTYNTFEVGLDFKIQLSHCSSSTQRALNPDKG